MHPYTEFEKTAIWKELQSEIEELSENQDIQLMTGDQYVVGSICKRLYDAGLLQEDAALRRIVLDE
jgi:hypothetical protein